MLASELRELLVGARAVIQATNHRIEQEIQPAIATLSQENGNLITQLPDPSDIGNPDPEIKEGDPLLDLVPAHVAACEAIAARVLPAP